METDAAHRFLMGGNATRGRKHLLVNTWNIPCYIVLMGVREGLELPRFADGKTFLFQCSQHDAPAARAQLTRNV